MTNQTKRKSFIIHKDSIEILDKLSDEQAGKLFKAIKSYQNNNILLKLDFTLDLVFTPFLNQFLRDDENYQIICERRRENGSKGGKQKVANAIKSKQELANLADSDSKSDSDSKKDSKNKNVFTKPTLEEIKVYCQERKNNVNPESFFDYYEAGNWKDAKGNAVKNWKQKLLTWEKKGNNEAIDSPLHLRINSIAGDDYVTKTYEREGVLKIVCRSPVSRSRIYELPEDKKNQIKALFGNQKFDFVC